MTAAAFAKLLHARRTGAGKWQARCPAHKDRSPSLSIREGNQGRVLLHCFAGCTHKEILAKLGIEERDLFAGPLPSPAQRASLQAAQEKREYLANRQRRELRRAWDDVRKSQAVVDQLGERLVRTPDDEAYALATLFHQACDQLHEAQTAAEQKEARAKGERSR
jgi:hypothetical protein